VTFPDPPIAVPNDGPLNDGSPDDGTPSDGAHIEYELDDWAVESRQMLRQLLVGAEVPHVWEAGRLVIPEAFEDQVDELVDQTAATFSGTLDDPDVPQVVFDVADFDDDLIDGLLAALAESDVDWAFDEGGQLVVPAVYTATVEQIVERLEFPHALPLADTDNDPHADDGAGTDGIAADIANDDDNAANADDDDDATAGVEIDPDRVLGGLFVATDRLARSATDSRGVLPTLELADELAAGAMPFGFDAPAWTRLKQLTAELVSLLTVVGSTDDEVESTAAELRDLLRRWV
jgi:hypothetical protein